MMIMDGIIADPGSLLQADGREHAIEGSGREPGGRVRPGHDYTRLHVTADHVLRAVDGLLTGLHEPEASHLDLLAAFLPAAKIRDVYEEAVRLRYLWHEFGDLNLIA
jgi:S-adenosylmethionine:tRNA ribosyltransferase-isomerase